jgi:pimeloyl-ACP methyl ester carboxylesterase
VVLVHGTGADRTQWGAVAALLAEQFTVHLVDRRGRGLSSEEAAGEYALEREAEDLAAVTEALDEPPRVFGHGFGGLCALKAAATGVSFDSMLIDDSPTGLPGPPMLPDAVTEAMATALSEGRPEDALVFFLQNIVGLSDEQIAFNRSSPMWQARVATVHTIVREARAAAGYERESAALAGVDVPVRFVVGEDSPPPFRIAAEAAHRDMPGSELVVAPRRMFTTMYADPGNVAQELGDWFSSPVRASA